MQFGISMEIKSYQENEVWENYKYSFTCGHFISGKREPNLEKWSCINLIVENFSMKASKTLHIFYSMLKSLPHIIVAQSLLDYSGYWGDHDLQKILLYFSNSWTVGKFLHRMRYFSSHHPLALVLSLSGSRHKSISSSPQLPHLFKFYLPLTIALIPHISNATLVWSLWEIQFSEGVASYSRLNSFTFF